MPEYDYKCEKCGHTFSDFQKIADRDKPTKKPCPKCNEKGGVEKQYCNPNAAVDLGMRSRVPRGFRDVISKIKKAHPHNTVHDY